MVSDDKPKSPVRDVGWLALFLIVIGVIWFAQGGPSRLTSTSPFLETPLIGPAPSRSSSQPSSKTSPKAENKENSLGEQSAPSIFNSESPYKNKVSLNSSRARETDPQKEYVEIRAVSKTEPILITGWTLKGREGLDIAIGQGASLPQPGQISQQNQIYLEGGDKAIIVTGQSPIGTSFRLNICAGYFSQFQKFFPSLYKECPLISEDNIPLSYPDACFNFVKNLSRCQIPTNIPYETSIKIGNDCLLFLHENANYNSCVSAYKNSEDFYKKEWRIYLGRSKELWNNQRDRIILRDQQGKIIDEVSY